MARKKRLTATHMHKCQETVEVSGYSKDIKRNVQSEWLCCFLSAWLQSGAQGLCRVTHFLEHNNQWGIEHWVFTGLLSYVNQLIGWNDYHYFLLCVAAIYNLLETLNCILATSSYNTLLISMRSWSCPKNTFLFLKMFWQRVQISAKMMWACSADTLLSVIISGRSAHVVTVVVFSFPCLLRSQQSTALVGQDIGPTSSWGLAPDVGVFHFHSPMSGRRHLEIFWRNSYFACFSKIVELQLLGRSCGFLIDFLRLITQICVGQVFIHQQDFPRHSHFSDIAHLVSLLSIRHGQLLILCLIFESFNLRPLCPYLHWFLVKRLFWPFSFPFSPKEN